MEFTDSIFKGLMNRPKSIKDEINETTKRKKLSFFRRELAEVQEILRVTGRESKFPMLCALSLLLFAIGVSIAIILGNLFLVPVIAIGFMLIPFCYVRICLSCFNK